MALIECKHCGELEYEGFTAAQVAYGLSHCGKSW